MACHLQESVWVFGTNREGYRRRERAIPTAPWQRQNFIWTLKENRMDSRRLKGTASRARERVEGKAQE